MAFTGQKIKGSRVLTPETIENRKNFHNSMNQLKEINETEYLIAMQEMLGSMFEHLSHSAQKEFINLAEKAEWKSILS